MPNLMSQWAEHYGGQSIEEFAQGPYTMQFKPELRNNCCMTLCCCWIMSKGNVGTFKAFINSKIGTAQVRGIQGLAKAAWQEAEALGGYYTGYIKEVFKIFGIRDANAQKAQPSRNSQEVRQFVMEATGFYQLHFKSSTTSSGHAIAFLNTGAAVQLFDPNYGLIEFNSAQRGGQLDFMLKNLFTQFYPQLNGKWDCLRCYFP